MTQGSDALHQHFIRGASPSGHARSNTPNESTDSVPPMNWEWRQEFQDSAHTPVSTTIPIISMNLPELIF